MSDSNPSLRFMAVATFGLWLLVAVTAAFVLATDVFLLTFLGGLFAVFLTKTSGAISSRMSLDYGVSLSLITLLLVSATGGTLYVFGHRVEQRVSAASQHLDGAANDLRAWVESHPIAETAVKDLPFASQLLSSEPLMTGVDEGRQSPAGSRHRTTESGSSEDQAAESQATGQRTLSTSRIGEAAQVIADVFRTTLGAVMNIAIVVFVGLYLAAAPTMYRDGFVRLFPHKRRERVTEILNQIGSTLWSWLLGRFASMAITGIGTGIGLAILGVPMPVILGGLTGLLTFIPNIGPAIGLAISLLVALPEGGTTAGLVVVVFLVFQLLESYLITPLIQHHQVSIPPAVLIIWQVLLGVLVGFLGVTVSTPILAVLFVLVQSIYLEDTLQDQLGTNNATGTDA